MLSSHTNPILSDFRDLHNSTGNSLWTDAFLSASDLIEEYESHDLSHWNHAMDVLIRIGRVFK